MFEILTAKPVLIGLHLGFAILGIDSFLWLLGEIVANAQSVKRRVIAGIAGLIGYVLTWIVGGYYYVKFYGPLVKPVIKAGSAPWAHTIAMEAKEHIFLFSIPIAITICLLARLSASELESFGIRKNFIYLTAIIAALGLSFGIMGFIISAATRWGAI
ncbi:hypothetical protein A3I27_01240 [Candidatus Giovannonibacteria bacterium RIFCSPLOWO2_02_FULL_43_11b]|uniref:DUF2269 domain-containing protein n=1 Tax=Candidatus Giovannonibacteria bacterium RIFCSPHIGHO2_12_FULL_43_15 TaxID=1798341 RepID=A0A1F5WPQ2_9BACT|nr:MAG: hypothetical protein A3B97_04055 [Candidatus Giovannonibacteria bacterium RIFCSPHIGHO2_02_FULL_43_32]OGF77662.1 MAG: hypothetical protein A3F23_03770 [Candidatus Giovannonibacteria bacterium RIFCSPHIGHO2_12_FULL_43_15]OGF78335.1 MAG: hypothetical protein A3A15_00495 [Candidatus Giovannonibacteria bacterium RIFCSPLOWO2_01_FULL_43_60]OGF90209.1 MAG: hypothetical protein A3I27_01240 [Candidatus Giovannonibacteria bacterium RIFCSPLOWO2_02_FULL_43_11b]OGF92120.1 MAG: hypothetical protein A3H